jgi:hypothetical protein
MKSSKTLNIPRISKKEIMRLEDWLERYDWYLDLSTKHQDWIRRVVIEVSPEVFVGLTSMHEALERNDFVLLAEIMQGYDELEDLIDELDIDDGSRD